MAEVQRDQLGYPELRRARGSTGSWPRAEGLAYETCQPLGLGPVCQAAVHEAGTIIPDCQGARAHPYISFASRSCKPCLASWASSWSHLKNDQGWILYRRSNVGEGWSQGELLWKVELQSVPEEWIGTRQNNGIYLAGRKNSMYQDPQPSVSEPRELECHERGVRCNWRGGQVSNQGRQWKPWRKIWDFSPSATGRFWADNWRKETILRKWLGGLREEAREGMNIKLFGRHCQ